MREQILNELGALLRDNLGQRLTPALATGIATLFNQAVATIEEAEAAGKAEEQGSEEALAYVEPTYE